MVTLGIFGSYGWDGNKSGKIFSMLNHDSNATLIIDGKYVASAAEERFTRIKHDGNYPEKSINALLENNNLTPDQVDVVAYVGCCNVFYFELSNAGMVEKFLQDRFPNAKLYEVGHHLAHGVGSFLTSPYDEASVYTSDAGGNKISAGADLIQSVSSFSTMTRNPFNVEMHGTTHVPNDTITDISLGGFYNMMSKNILLKLGVKDVSHLTAPGKVMGLSAYGDEQKYATYDADDKKKHDIYKFSEEDFPKIILSNYGDEWQEVIQQKYLEKWTDADIAGWVQKYFEDLNIEYLNAIPKKYKKKNLCLGGGCSLNVLLNTKIISEGLFEDVHVNTAPSDDGLGLGAALYIHTKYYGNVTLPKNIGTVGIDYSNDRIVHALSKSGEIHYTKYENFDEIIDIACHALQKNDIVAWFQGKSEYGPRALGNRSIFANPSFKNKDRLNNDVKYRESWRPYAAIVLEEELLNWFDIPKKQSPYMMFSGFVKKDKQQKLISVTHIDNSCRVQTVNVDQNEKSYKLLKEFNKRTGIPALLNTSFNTIPGEPIVETPENALRSFLHSNINLLVIGDYIVTKNKLYS